MHKITIAALAGLSSLAFAAPAMAQDDPLPFDGLYVGGAIGYDVQKNDVNERIAFDRNLDGVFGDTVLTAAGANAFGPGFCNGQAISNVPTGGCRNDRDNISYYGRVGYDKQVGNSFFGGALVVGVVGEFGKSEITDSVSAFSTTPASYTLRREMDYDANVRLRAGYVRNTTMFYATSGGAYARVDNSFLTTNLTNSFSSNGKSDAWGFVTGGGLEQKIGPSFSIGIEYLYHHLKDDDYRVRAGAGTAPATNPFILAPNTTGTDFRRSFEYFKWHSVRTTASFRF